MSNPHLDITVTGHHAGENTNYSYKVRLYDHEKESCITIGGVMMRGHDMRTSQYSNNFIEIADKNPQKFITDMFFNPDLAQVIFSWYNRDDLRKVAYFVSEVGRCPSPKEYYKIDLMESLK